MFFSLDFAQNSNECEYKIFFGAYKRWGKKITVARVLMEVH